MPRRSILTAAERDSLFALPDTTEEIIRHYTFSESDLSVIRQRRGHANRLGFAIQLSYMRYPGIMLPMKAQPHTKLLNVAAEQLKVSPALWTDFGQRAETRREHLLELQQIFGFQPFSAQDYRSSVNCLEETASQTDKGILLAGALVAELRSKNVLLPSAAVIERICTEAITCANRRIYAALTDPLSGEHRDHLDALLRKRDNGRTTQLAWLRQSPAKPNSRHMLEHLERLKAWHSLDLPAGFDRLIHQN